MGLEDEETSEDAGEDTQFPTRESLTGDGAEVASAAVEDAGADASELGEANNGTDGATASRPSDHDTISISLKNNNNDGLKGRKLTELAEN